MISATAWVPRGYAAEFAEKYELDDSEIQRIEQMAGLSLGDMNAEEEIEEEIEEEDEDEDAAHNDPESLRAQADIDNDMGEYDMEEQGEEPDGPGEDVSMFPAIASENVKFHEGEDGADPYLSLPTEGDQLEDKSELQVYPTDNMVLATRTEDDVSYLDVYVYDDGAGFHGDDIPTEAGDEADPDVARGLVRDSSLYVHHDLMLPAFPLCVEWMNYRPGSNDDTGVANFAAIGTFDPQIEIWNLDCVEKAFPDMILGEPADNSMAALNSHKKSKKKTLAKHVTTHHTDAVLSLAHNRQFRSVLASTSADHTVKLWDLNSGSAVRSLAAVHDHKNVSASQWHQTNGSILLTAGYDARVALSDVRIADEKDMSKYWSVSQGEEIETAVFADENIILCGTDSGNVYSFDIRNSAGSRPVWTLKAHDSGVSSLAVNNFIPGLMSTGAMGEKAVKLWKFPTGQEGQTAKGPHMVLSRDFDVGNVLTTSFAPDIEVAGTMVIGGVNKGLKLWDVFSNRTVRKGFADELQGVKQLAREEAKRLGRSSRISRKYIRNDNPDTVVTIEDQGEDEEERDGEEQ